MEYFFSIITLSLGVWGVSWFILDALNRKKRLKSLYRVSKRWEDEDGNNDLAGKIVKIKNVNSDGECYVQAVEPVIKRQKVYPQMYAQQQYFSSYMGQAPMIPDTSKKPRWEEYEDYIEGYVDWKYLKRVKNLNKGGEKKVKRMPRLWKWLIVYIPLTILVWDFVTNINAIVLWLATTLPHR